MPFEIINQFHKSGCLIACIAMITKSSYKDILNHLFPNRNYMMASPVINVSIELNKLPFVLDHFNIKYKLSEDKSLASLKSDALIVLQWRNEPQLSHCILFDKSKSKIIDPSVYLSKRCNSRVYQKHVHSIYLL